MLVIVGRARHPCLHQQLVDRLSSDPPAPGRPRASTSLQQACAGPRLALLGVANSSVNSSTNALSQASIGGVSGQSVDGWSLRLSSIFEGVREEEANDLVSG
jgi:hypothetical protein